jgi:PAS domain S-box-containing protein
VPGSRWFLLVKKDLAEIDEPLTRLAWQLGAAMAMIAATILAGLGWVWKSHQLRMQQESEERLRSFANDTPALLWALSAEGRSAFVNQSLGDFVGTDGLRSSVEWQRYLHPDDSQRVTAHMESCFRDRTRFSDEGRIRRADGEYRWILGQGLPRIAPNGEFRGYAGALLDITERKEAEQRLRRLNEELALNLREKAANEAEIRGLSARLINAHEDERRRLSRELHDDLSQQIAALSIGTGNLKRGIPKESIELRAHCDKLQRGLIDVSESVRRMSHELHPSVMQHLGVVGALRGCCRDFQELSGVRVALRIDGDGGDVAPDVALTVFRIVQESLRNIAKHACIDRAEVVFSRLDAEVRLLVRDEGVGLPPDGSAKAGLGLVSIRERIRLVNGTIDIVSAPGKGTGLYVRIPINIRGGNAQTANGTIQVRPSE